MKNLLSRLFRKTATPLERPPEGDEPIVPVFIPPLVALLVHHEKEKGSPLTEDEVIAIRSNAVCMTMRVSMAKQMAEKRGYSDVSAENCWIEWKEVRRQLQQEDAEQENA